MKCDKMGLFTWLFGAPLDAETESEVREIIRDFDNEFTAMCNHYVLDSERQAFIESHQDKYDKVTGIHIPKSNSLYDDVIQYMTHFRSIDNKIAKANKEFIRKEMSQCDDFLSDIDSKSLDNQQRTVVVTDEDRTLVLAGAGSGKTLTIAGKVKYLCEIKNVLPEDILLIAFTKKSAEEITERINERLHIDVKATTFHKLGLDIISEATGKRPEVRAGIKDFVRSYFQEKVVSQQSLVKQLIEFFAYYLSIPANIEEYESLGEAYDYEKAADFESIKSKCNRAGWISREKERQTSMKRTIKDEEVRSLEEVSIANFLFLNGVNYEYEKEYPFENEDLMRKAYRPDFYLSDYDIYLEHFGISKDNRLPWLSKVEEEKYLSGMIWKRNVHKEHGTKLIETYSYLSSEGRLLQYLDQLLKENGIQYKQLDFKEIFEKLYQKQSDKYFSEFIDLCCSFLTLFKSKGYTEKDLMELQCTNKEHRSQFYQERASLFKAIIKPLIEAYEIELEHCGEIDFSDMIIKATGIVNAGHRVHEYRYVIIDEYQDISVARYGLVKAILKQTGAKLLCVGDDWQSIYRFAGSDINLFTNFETYFGKGMILRLEQTYRNAQQLIDEAGRFIMRNPSQLKKNLRSSKNLNSPIVFMCYEKNPFAVLKETIDKIIAEYGTEASILLLGRINTDKQILLQSGFFHIRNTDALEYLPSPRTPITFLTVHKAKGLESDNVILLNFMNSTLGFPNKIADDSLLEMVLTAPEQYPYAEERRLFYVALTRTRNKIYVLTDKESPSEFYHEFKESNAVYISSPNISQKEELNCPRCKTGHLVMRENENSKQYFIGCNHYPRCDFSVRDTSVLTIRKICPECEGLVTIRKGKYGAFYACTNYPICKYTDNVKSDRQGE